MMIYTKPSQEKSEVRIIKVSWLYKFLVQINVVMHFHARKSFLDNYVEIGSISI